MTNTAETADLPVFPARLAHYPDEPSYSLLLRTAEFNGAVRPYTVFRHYGAQGGIGPTSIDLDEVARTCKADPAALRFASADLNPDTATVLGETFDRRQYSALSRRWCPQCLAEAPHHRVWWDIVPITTCPLHGVDLVDRCECDVPLRTMVNFVGYCRHGHDLAEVPTTPAPADSLAVDGYIVRRLLRINQPAIPYFDATPLEDVIEQCERTGRQDIDPDSRLNTSRQVGDRRKFLARGFEILADLDGAFSVFLDDLSQQDHAVKRKWGLEKLYGRYYMSLVQAKDTALRTAMLDAIARNAAHKTILKGGKVLGRDVHNEDTITLGDAAKMCGLTFERFRRLAVTLGLVPKDWGQGTPYRIDRGRIEDLAARLEGNKDLHTISAELATTDGAVARMADAGLLEFIVHGGGNKKGLNKWIFHRDAAKTLLERLDALVPAELDSGEHLAHIALAGQSCYSSLAIVVPLILDGKLAIRGLNSDATGLLRFLVDKGECQREVRRLRAPGLTLQETADRYGVSAQVMASWVNAGALPTKKVGRVRTIQEEDLAAFQGRYATGAELARAAGMNIRGTFLTGRLKKAGIQPVYDRPQVEQALFDRKTTMDMVGWWGEK